MRIGFYFNDLGFENLDLSDPCSGNNGVGGTQYCFLMVADAVLKLSNYDLEVIFYSYHENKLPKGVKNKKISDWKNMIMSAQNDAVDILIYRADANIEMIRALGNTTLKCIAWAHNFLYKKEIDELSRCKNVRRVVFVGKQQYDTYIDHEIIKKSTYIFNMFDSCQFSERPLPEKKTVTYTGNLDRTKGFHLLAFVWKDIVKAVPDAQLYVIGGGKLYDRDLKLGELGVARKEYEDLFAPFLIEDGKVLDSVHFLGVLGKEKNEIYYQTMVGVMNPSGRSETFGLSGLEMAACGIPVVTKGKYGLLDTVVDGETGYLIQNQHELKNAIIKLLTDSSLNKKFGHNAKKFADTHFQPEATGRNWLNLFKDILEEKTAEYLKPSDFMLNDKKWLRVLNRKLHAMHIPTPAVVEVDDAFRNLKMNIRKR